MSKTGVCKQCEGTFVDKYRDGKKFCDRKCAAEWRRGKPTGVSRLGEDNPNWRGGNVRACLNCGEQFVDEHYYGKKFCNRKCYGEHRRKAARTEITCLICKKTFVIMKHDKHKRKYCSSQCMGQDKEKCRLTQEKRKGWKMSDEARQKISIANSNRDPQQYYTRGKSGHHDSPKAGKIFYRSSYELRAFQLLDKNPNVSEYIAEPLVIVYQDRFGVTRRYRPDILIHWNSGRTTLVEIKPAWRYDYPEVLEKFTAGTVYAHDRGWEFRIWNEFSLGLVPGQTGPTCELRVSPSEREYGETGRYQGQTGPTEAR